MTGTTDLDPLNIPEDKARGLIKHCLERDIDVSYSYRMQVDHGFTQPLDLLCQDQLDRDWRIS